MSLPVIGARVDIINEDGFPIRTGKVAGHGAVHRPPSYDEDDRRVPAYMQPILLVQLTSGFFSPEGSSFIEFLPVDPANLRVTS